MVENVIIMGAAGRRMQRAGTVIETTVVAEESEGVDPGQG